MRIAVLLLAAATVSACQGATGIEYQGTLPQALLLVDQTFHVSVLGEIVDPVPRQISIQNIKASTPQAVLASIVSQCPGYVLVNRKGAFIVAQKDLFEDPSNPMNAVVRDFQVPGNLSDFKLGFTSAVGNAQQGIQGFGGVWNGATLPESISVPLEEEVLHNQTGREILLHVATKVGSLFSVFSLPTAHPHEQMLRNSSLQVWELAGGPGVLRYKAKQMVHPESDETN